MLYELRDPSTRQEWIDVVEPTEAELAELAEKYQLPSFEVRDSLDPAHLPKYVNLDGNSFFIVRHADPAAYKAREADTIQELTRKIAVFATPARLITIHRVDQPFISSMRDRFQTGKLPERSVHFLVIELMRNVLLSYEPVVEFAEDMFAEIESRVLNELSDARIIEELYFLKQKGSVYKRVVRLTLDVIHRIDGCVDKASPLFRDLKEEGEHLFVHVDELIEDTTALLNTHISISSHRTNEIVRVLTLFSVFFMPLTFIVGVYGMNFKFMPELNWKFGYLGSWAVMGAVTFGIYLWFKRRGWLR